MPDLRIPKRINPNKIIDCTVEVRFESETPSDIVVALIYNAVRGTWGDGALTPIAKIPSEIRDSEDQLRFQAHRRWSRDSWSLIAGPHMVGVGTTAFESGTATIQMAAETFRPLEGIFGRITRLGMRYINLFEGENIHQLAALKVLLRGEELGRDPLFVRAELDKGAFVCALQAANPAGAEISGAKKSGSILDIDVSSKPTTAVPPKVDAISRHLVEMHGLAERAFFSVLSDEYIARLNPEY